MTAEDIAEIARRFDKFVKDVDKKKHSPGQYGLSAHPPVRYLPTEEPPDRTLLIYEGCLEWLTKDDLTNLDHILKKMAEALVEIT